jgi:hypothetical protein
MGTGPNYVLDKGFRVEGTDAVVQGTFAKFGTGEQSAVANDTVNGPVLGVFQENIDADKVATGKVVADVRILGIARVRAGGAITKGNSVASSATGLAVDHTTGAAVGIALSAASAGEATAGAHVDVLLTPVGA